MDKFKKWLNKNMVVVILIALIIIFGLANKTFFTPKNLINILSQMSINALICTGITFVVISGGIDISVGSVAAFAGIFSTSIALNFPNLTILQGIVLQVVCAIIIGFICGLFNGLMIAKLKVVPMIATLAMMNIARGFAYVVTDGQPVYGLPDTFAFIGSARLIKTEAMPQGVVPVIAIFTFVIVIFMNFILTRTVFGRHVYAVGSNESVAHLSGVNVDRAKIWIYIICSIMAALGGVSVASKLNNGQPASADGYEMFAIAATVLGGTSLSGGSGSVARAMIGVALIAVINNGMNLMQVSSYWQKVIIGVIILVAVIMDMQQKRRKD